MKMRLLLTGTKDAFSNIAIDEALMESPDPVLRMYSWKPPAVSLGFFQRVQDEVDETACRKLGVDVIRRQTGGGAVFHDNELTYSVVLRKYPTNIFKSYEWICSAVIDGLATAGIKAEFSPLNDITVDGKKISGCAQTRRKGVLLQHGTLLLGVDIEKMFTILKVPDEKLKGKLISDVRQRVTALPLSFDEAVEAIKRGFEIRMGAQMFESNLTDKEIADSEQIANMKYRSKGWLYRV